MKKQNVKINKQTVGRSLVGVSSIIIIRCSFASLLFSFLFSFSRNVWEKGRNDKIENIVPLTARLYNKLLEDSGYLFRLRVQKRNIHMSVHVLLCGFFMKEKYKLRLPSTIHPSIYSRVWHISVSLNSEQKMKNRYFST